MRCGRRLKSGFKPVTPRIAVSERDQTCEEHLKQQGKHATEQNRRCSSSTKSSERQSDLAKTSPSRTA
eukprot:1370195-Rhodomonas_salina.1